MTKQIKMTPELREQLLGLVPMDSNATISFTPTLFDGVDEEYRPVFKMKQFNNEQVLSIKELMFNDINKASSKKKKINIRDIDKTNKKYMEFLNDILVEWDKLIIMKEDTTVAEMFEYDGTLDCLLMVPESIRTELFGEAIQIAGLVPRG